MSSGLWAWSRAWLVAADRRHVARILVPALVVGCAVGLGAARSEVLVALTIGTALAVLAAAYPRTGFYLALAVGMLQYGPTRAYRLLPDTLTLIDDVLLVLLVLRWMGDAARRRTQFPVVYLRVVAVWMTLAVLVAAVSGVETAIVLGALRGLFLSSTFFILAFAYSSDEQGARVLVRLILVVCLMHAIVAFAQAARANAIGDPSFGLLAPGGANALGFLMLFGCALCVALMRTQSRAVVILCVLSLALVVAGSRGAMLVWPVVLVVTTRGSWRERLVLGLVLAGAVGSLLAVHSWVVQRGQADVLRLSPAYLWESQNVPEWGGRAVYMRALPGLLASQGGALLVGLGPGQYTSNTGVANNAEAYVATRPTSTTSPTGFAYADGQWTAIAGEYGLLGLAFAGLLIVHPLWTSRSARRWQGSRGVYREAVCAAMPGLFVATVAGGFVLNLFEYQPVAAVWWALAGTAVAATQRMSLTMEH